MKQRKSSSIKDELGINDLTCRVKSEKGVTGIISLEGNDVKRAVESAMTLYFKSLGEIFELQRKARVVRDG